MGAKSNAAITDDVEETPLKEECYTVSYRIQFILFTCRIKELKRLCQPAESFFFQILDDKRLQ